MQWLKRYGKLLLFVAIIAVVLVLNAVFGFSSALADPQRLPVLQQALKQNLAKAMLIYMGVTIAGCVVLALPGVVFAIAAGILFGPLWGTIACSLATTLGASLAFLAGRYFLQDAVKPLVMKNRHIRRLFFEESGKSDLFLLMLTRLVPIFPYNLQNFAYGITDIKFLPYTLYSFVFMLPGTAVYTIAASGITDAENRWLYFSVAIVLFAAVTGVSLFLKRKSARREEQEEPKAGHGPGNQ